MDLVRGGRSYGTEWWLLWGKQHQLNPKQGVKKGCAVAIGLNGKDRRQYWLQGFSHCSLSGMSSVSRSCFPDIDLINLLCQMPTLK